MGACAANYGNCDSKTSNGCETYLINNNSHCGKCGTSCGSGSYNACGSWSYYCSGTQRRRKRTCYKRGCSGTSCFNTAWTHDELYQNCPTGSSYEYRCSGTWRQRRTITKGCYSNSCANSYSGWGNLTNCGSGSYNSCGGWSYYCSGSTVRRKRTCYKRGCSGSSCYNNSWTNDVHHQTCGSGYKCSSGKCVSTVNCNTNVAKSAKPSSSGCGQDRYGYGPKNLNDGRTCSSRRFCWTCNGGWVRYDWSSAVQVRNIKIDTIAACSSQCGGNAGRNAYTATVQYLHGSSWKTVANLTGKSNDWSYNFPSTVTTKAIRLSGLNTPKHCGQRSNPLIIEWYVYSCAK